MGMCLRAVSLLALWTNEKLEGTLSGVKNDDVTMTPKVKRADCCVLRTKHQRRE